MAELVDAQDSGSCVRKDVGVQVPPRPPLGYRRNSLFRATQLPTVGVLRSTNTEMALRSGLWVLEEADCGTARVPQSAIMWCASASQVMVVRETSGVWFRASEYCAVPNGSGVTYSACEVLVISPVPQFDLVV